MAVWADELAVDSTGNTLTINKIVHVASLGKYVAVGKRNGTIPTNANAIWTSVDGITWKLQLAAQGYSWTSVAWSPALGLFAAVTETVLNAVGGLVTDQVMTSPDGIVWTSRNSAERNAWQDILWADSLNLFVAVANNSGDGLSIHRVMTSPDGVNWSTQTPAGQPTNFGWSAVAWGGNKLVATAGDAGTTSVMTSPDGINWTQRNFPTAVGARNRGLAYSPTLHMFMLSCGGGHVLRSTDGGVTWTDWTGPPAGWNSTLGNQCAWCPLNIVAFTTGTADRALLGISTGAVFCISAGAGIAAIITSGDGLTWVTEALPSVQSWGALGAQQPQTIIAPPGAIIGPAGTPAGPSAGPDSGPSAGCIDAISPGKDSAGV